MELIDLHIFVPSKTNTYFKRLKRDCINNFIKNSTNLILISNTIH